MGRSNWVPSKCGVLCSSHFEKNCIDFRDSRARLRKEKVDIQYQCDIPPLKCQPLADQSINIYHQEVAFKTDQQILQSVNIEQSLADRLTDHQFSNALNHDHVYDDPPDIVKQKLGVAGIKIKKLTNENQILRQKAKRACETLNSMKDLVSQLRDFKQLCNNGKNSQDSRQMIHLLEQLICRFTNSRNS